MSLDHAILGFLNYKSMSGYDLKSVFDMSVNHFWPADQSQIYRTLSRLTEGGMTTIEVVEQNDRPDRKVYHITDQGREELRRWLASPLQTKDQRIAELVQVFFAGQLPDGDILEMFQLMRDRCSHALDKLRSIPNRCDESISDAKQSQDAFFWMLTLDYGITMTEACLAWTQEVIAKIERGEHKGNESSGS